MSLLARVLHGIRRVLAFLVEIVDAASEIAGADFGNLVMPVMDGWALLEAKNRDPALRSIPAIVVTGSVASKERLPLPTPSTFPSRSWSTT